MKTPTCDNKMVVKSERGFLLGWVWFTKGGFWRGDKYYRNAGTASKPFTSEAEAVAFVKAYAKGDPR